MNEPFKIDLKDIKILTRDLSDYEPVAELSSVTIFPVPSGGAVVLEEPTATRRPGPTSPVRVPNEALWRGLLTSESALKIIDNKKRLNLNLSLLINQVLKDLEAEIGSLEGRDVYIADWYGEHLFVSQLKPGYYEIRIGVQPGVGVTK